jgi:hypothetical protein
MGSPGIIPIEIAISGGARLRRRRQMAVANLGKLTPHQLVVLKFVDIIEKRGEVQATL